MQNDSMFNRLLKINLKSKNSFFLFGPRGTGKTTWIKNHLPDALYLDLLHFPLFRDLQADPSRLENLIPPNYTDIVIIDEVQRVPLLLHEVHRLIESKKLRFLLTGSSARSLRKKGVNLLAGRALKYHMHPLTIQEMGDAFSLPTVLKYGLLPEAVTGDDPERYLETYLETYLQQEIIQEGMSRNIGSFYKFLEVASFSQGSLLNMTEIAREVGVNRLTVANYFSILEDMLIAYRLQPFTKRAKRRLVAHSKFYYFDIGVYRRLRPIGLLDSREGVEGIALESLFFQSLLAINDYFDLKYKFFFWRTPNGMEVDFIAYGPTGLHAFEIKRSSQVNTKALSNLFAFQQDFPEAKLHFIYMGSRKEYHDKIQVIPFVEALKELPRILSS